MPIRHQPSDASYFAVNSKGLSGRLNAALATQTLNSFGVLLNEQRSLFTDQEKGKLKASQRIDTAKIPCVYFFALREGGALEDITQLELTQTHMAQKSMLRVEGDKRCLCAWCACL